MSGLIDLNGGWNEGGGEGGRLLVLGLLISFLGLGRF